MNTINIRCRSVALGCISPPPFRAQIANPEPRRWRWGFGVIPLLLVAILPSSAEAQETLAQFFKRSCTNCHTIGGGYLNAPDLKNVNQRAKRQWLIDFMMNPRATIDSGDPYAKKIFADSKNQYMPPIQGMTAERGGFLLDLIKEESAKPKSIFIGAQESTRPFLPQDYEDGKAIFLGLKPLDEKGPACISCHTMHDTASLGGGRLGGDLTKFSEKKKDRNAVSAWLSNPAAEMMQPVFANKPMTEDEIHALTAYFEGSAKSSEADPSASRVAFLLMGLLLAIAIVFGFDAIWKHRFHSVRKPLVDSNQV